jgi:ribonuclease HI
MTRKVVLHCDGASRGNPGPASAGAQITEPGTQKVLAEVSEALGVATNNVAEYMALLLGLEKALSLGAAEILIRADSQLLIRQVNGQYRVKHPDMKQLHARALGLLSRFQGWQAEHVPREQNREADRLANQALDRPRAPHKAPGDALKQGTLFH